AELLARLHPGTEAAVLREQLPADDQLKEVSMLSLMLALRADSAEGAITLLQQPHRQPTPLQVLEERWGGQRITTVRPEPGAIPLAELAGLDEARDIAVGITEDLRSWAAGTLDWRDVHRGLLIAGPPGCGKTELARAMAREPGIHLEAGSYATWQAAGHLGLMLEAMRESFRRAAAQAPSVLFIDEIDSFGSRVGGRTSRNESYEEKVIGGLLELLDGIGGRQGVVVSTAVQNPATRRGKIRPGGGDR
ncbi:AAA family ATPase, partial [Paracoccus fontiphilus]